MAYMSCSQYQSFCECEAKAMAKLQGRWEDEPKEAFLVGNYFHSYFESAEAHAEFLELNETEIYLKQTRQEAAMGIRRLRAPFIQADKMIQTALNDPLISSILDMPGENEKILIGRIFGVPWRIRMDKYVPDGRLIVDYKTVANIWETKWSDEIGGKVTFIDAYDYMLRAAVYSEIEKQAAGADTDPQFLIIAISKQEHPDKEVLSLNHRQRYDYELEKIRKRLPMIQMVKEGRVRPKRCGRCDYCRATKTLESIKPYYALMPEFREVEEDDFGAGSLLDNTPAEEAMGSMSPMSEAAELGASGI